MQRPLVIYLAAPYTATTTEGIERNVRRARYLATYYRQKGAAVIVPHQESLGCETSLSEPQWLAHCLALAERCDLIVRLEGPSKGADLETAWLSLLGKPVAHASIIDGPLEEGVIEAPSVEELRRLIGE